MSTLPTSPVGTLLNKLTKGRLFPFEDQKPGFVVPEKYLFNPSSSSSSSSSKRTATDKSHQPKYASNLNQAEAGGDHDATAVASVEAEAEDQGQETAVNPSRRGSAQLNNLPSVEGATIDVEKMATKVFPDSARNEEREVDEKEPSESQYVIVDWHDEKDPENPQNWSRSQKAITAVSISFMTFAVYLGSAVYTPSIEGVMHEFGVSQVKAVLGLSLFVFGYAFGPMVLSPLSEIPAIGRNGVYFPALLLFVLFNVGAARAPDYSTLMAMRFLTGFVGSPALSTGGASLSDVFSQIVLPYLIAVWAVGAVSGPVLGPVMGGFAAMNAGWRWPLYILLILSGLGLAVVSLLLPETLGDKILLERAKRLRRLTGNPNLRSQGELKQASVSLTDLVSESLYRPVALSFEPQVAFSSIYLGLVYALFYLWFESFPLVFGGIYGWNLGVQSLAFLGIAIGATLTVMGYVAYLKYVYNPRFHRKLAQGIMVPEDRLEIALFASIFIPISLLLFGWTSRSSVHWIAPIIASALYMPGIFLLFQSILVYLPMSYPKYAASVLAANALLRSVIAAGFPLFGSALFTNLGIGPACSLLAGLSLIMIVPLYMLKRYGAKLRQWSRYAQTY
ncbi:MFS general substrate transporter [Violaceomyces palustris]|uniref:MFS general substrate transporter n=1 Tax=Violaceomyces palustris TaxID=1673888 RepID=A0ACD0NM30_9BASI|nr:MFS general substrate transporter [Violaceomyces palustris]